jgi:2-dehydropantoate 2-reductase
VKIAILGAGSIGTITGALLKKNGADVTLIDSNAEHVRALNENGAIVTGKMDLRGIPVKAILPERMEGVYDVVYLLTKQTANHVVLPRLSRFLNADSVVCTLQNGIPEESVAKYVGRERTVGGVTGWGAEYAGPGVSRLTSEPDRMVFEVGELDGRVTPRIERVAETLSVGVTCRVIRNLAGVRWSKLITNATMSGISAATDASYGEIADDDRAVRAAAYQANEVIRVAGARGVKLEVLFEGYDFYDLLFDSAAGLEDAIRWLRAYYEPDRQVVASMLRDMRMGVPCEISQICGVVADLGDELGVETPMLDTCIRIVKEFEAGERPFPSFDNIGEFVIPGF